VNEHKYHFVEPGRARRQHAEELRAILRQPGGRDRADRLARLVRTFHEGREINLALDTAQQCLVDADGDLAPLLTAYDRSDRPDLRIEDLAMLAHLGRWLEHARLAEMVRSAAYEEALGWCRDVDGRERERRLDVLRRRFDPDLADQVDVALH
jgi:hypothetical protein